MTRKKEKRGHLIKSNATESLYKALINTTSILDLDQSDVINDALWEKLVALQPKVSAVMEIKNSLNDGHISA